MKARFLLATATAIATATAAAALMLVGCANPIRTPLPVQTKTRPPAGAPPTVLPTAVRTLVPAESAYPVQPTRAGTPEKSAYPAPQTPAGEAATGYPAPRALGASGPAIQSKAAPFQDCARTPGLVGCAPDAVPIQAHLAYIDTTPSRLVGLDLENGQGWQLALPPEPAAVGLDWSPPRAIEARLLVLLDDERYQVFSAGGAALEHGAGQGRITWGLDAMVSGEGAVYSADGDAAVLEQTPDLTWMLTVKTDEGEKRLAVDSTPGDILYSLLGWAPDGERLLGLAYFAGNQAMTQGGQLITIDAGSGAVQEYPARMPVSDFSEQLLAWDPTRPARLAFLESGETGVIAPRLALLNLENGEAQYPLPEGLLISGLAWHPAGRLAVAVGSVEGLIEPDARQAFPSAGIYLLDPQSGQTQNLVSAPPRTVDTWPNWSADGDLLVYARVLAEQGDASILQVRARRISDGAEWVVVEGLPVSGNALEADFARRWLALRLK